MSDDHEVSLLGAGEIRDLAARHGIRPTKQWGQNFVVDGNTVRRIVRVAGVGPGDTVIEVGPGLGSLTLALLPEVDRVVAIEVDPVLAAALPETVAQHAPTLVDRLDVVQADALTVTELPGPAPTALVANLPYNVSVPVVLRFLELFPTVRTILVMVQLEVAERLAAGPGSKTYGVPNVDSGLVALTRREPPVTDATRQEVFACVDAAFAQRRKTLRAALASWAGSPALAEAALTAAGVDPRTRGEQLDVATFAAVASARVQAVQGP